MSDLYKMHNFCQYFFSEYIEMAMLDISSKIHCTRQITMRTSKYRKILYCHNLLFLDLVHHLKFLRAFTSQLFESWLCFCLQVRRN